MNRYIAILSGGNVAFIESRTLSSARQYIHNNCEGCNILHLAKVTKVIGVKLEGKSNRLTEIGIQ